MEKSDCEGMGAAQSRRSEERIAGRGRQGWKSRGGKADKDGKGKDGKVEAGRAARTGKERRVGIENEPEMIGQIKKNRYFCRLIW